MNVTLLKESGNPKAVYSSKVVCVTFSSVPVYSAKVVYIAFCSVPIYSAKVVYSSNLLS
jgi:hypothetical protein